MRIVWPCLSQEMSQEVHSVVQALRECVCDPRLSREQAPLVTCRFRGRDTRGRRCFPADLCLLRAASVRGYLDGGGHVALRCLPREHCTLILCVFLSPSQAATSLSTHSDSQSPSQSLQLYSVEPTSAAGRGTKRRKTYNARGSRRRPRPRPQQALQHRPSSGPRRRALRTLQGQWKGRRASTGRSSHDGAPIWAAGPASPPMAPCR